MYNFWLHTVKILNRFLKIFGFRKEQTHWGVVYDSVTKQPIDPAIVKLIDAESGKVVESSVTDMKGRYGFVAVPGKFKIFVQRSNYEYPSETVKGERDGVYDNVYHGEFFVLSGDSDVIALNIPLDPLKADWNQEAKRAVVKYSPYLDYLWTSLVRIIFWFGFVLAILLYYKTGASLYSKILAGYGAIFVLALVLPKVKLWGKVSTKKEILLTDLVVELRHADLPDVIVAKANVAGDGKFFLRANKGKYILKIKDQKTNGMLFEKRIRVTSEGIVNEKFSV